MDSIAAVRRDTMEVAVKMVSKYQVFHCKFIKSRLHELQTSQDETRRFNGHRLEREKGEVWKRINRRDIR